MRGYRSLILLFMSEPPVDHTVRVLIHIVCMIVVSVCAGLLTHSALISVFSFFLLLHFFTD